jgi:glycosyltransferase involved in cell wall biosynthesis
VKVLFLTPQLPYPPISGGVIKSHKLLSFLVEHYQVGVACLLKSEADEQNLPIFKATLPQVPVYSLPLSLARTPLNFALSCLAGVPLTIYRNRAAAFKQYVDSVVNDYDVIFVDHYLMAQYVPKHFSGRVVVHQHNAEFLIWSRMAEQTTNWLKKSILHFESRRIKNYEVAMCARADAVLAAPNDQQALLEAGAVGDRFFDTYHLGDEENLDCPALEFEPTSLNV